MEAGYLDLFVCYVYTCIINCANLALFVSTSYVAHVAHVILMELITEMMHGED